MRDGTRRRSGSRDGAGDVRRILAGLRRELDDDLERIGDLSAVRARRAEVAELEVDLDAQLDRVRGAAVITLVGSTGAGKSTLLNALVGRPVANEGESRPTTTAPVIYRPRDADLAELIEGLPGEPPRIVDYDPEGGGPWREQILIDAPDTNSIEAAHREVVQALAARSDVLVVVTHRQSIAELSSVEFVEGFARRRGMLLVLNRADELTDAARGELLEQLRGIKDERFQAPDARVIATSAKRARSQPDTPGWSELCEELQTLVHAGSLSRVRRHNALGTAAALAELFDEVRAQAGPAFDELEESVRSGLERWREATVREIGERLTLRSASLRALLWNETARHWDGPGGWALRAGGLSALGFGAGAALARRNPLLAAGAAVGALAADKARDVARRKSFSAAAGLLPASVELESSYRTELGAARLAAGRLTGEAEGLAVPGAEVLALAAEDAVTDAWNRLVERDLVQAAARAARWFVRWPVDLPVYALGGWVVWRAANGFYDGDYVGLDFLVNTALILGAWLFVARAAVRMVLSGRGAGLLAGAREHAGQALALATDRHAERAHEEVAERRAALERLADLDERWRARIAPDGT